MSLGLKTWTQGETLTYTDLNSNFSKIAAKLGALKNSDFSDDAGITSTKLNDRFAIAYQTVTVPNVFYDGTDIVWGDDSEPIAVADSATASALGDTRIQLSIPGKRAYLCAVDGWMRGITNAANGTSVDSIGLYIYKNATLLTGSALEIDPSDGAEQVFAIKNSDPFASPLDEIQTGDYFNFKIGKFAKTDGNEPGFTAMSITFTYKVELVG